MVNRGLPSRRLAALGHQLSYLRGAETALLRLTARNTKKCPIRTAIRSCRTVARQVRSQLCIEEQRQVIAAFATGPFDVASLPVGLFLLTDSDVWGGACEPPRLYRIRCL